MSESSEPFVVRRSFTYSSFSYLALAAMVAFYIWLIYELHRQAGWSAWVVLITLLLPGGILEWSLQPTRFVEEGERLTGPSPAPCAVSAAPPPPGAADLPDCARQSPSATPAPSTTTSPQRIGLRMDDRISGRDA